MITERLWISSSDQEKKRLFALLILLVIIQLSTIVHLAYHLFSATEIFPVLFDIGIIAIGLFALICLVKKRTNCVLNTAFFIPLFVYVFFMPDLSLHIQTNETIIKSTGWLLAGAFFLFYYSDSKSKIILYTTLSIITIIFQLIKTNQFFNLSTDNGFQFLLPLLAFIAIITAGFLLLNKHYRITAELTDKLNTTRQGISTIMRTSSFPIARINVQRDEEGNIIHLVMEKVNPAFESYFNIQLHEVKNQEANYLFELAFKEHIDLNKILLFEKSKIKEIYASKLDLWFEIHVLKPDYQSIFVILKDVTREKKKVADLERNKLRYQVLLEAIPDMFFVIGKDGIFEDFVIKESDLFKIQDTNIIGSTLFDVGFPANMAEKIMSCVHTCLKTNSLEVIEYSMNTPNGTYLFEMRLARLNARTVISISRDITRRKNAEFNLERALKKAEESDRLKSVFLSNLSHEIRTPLNIITNYTRILAEGGLGIPERTEVSDGVMQNSAQLLNMIDNTIHLSKIETDSLEVFMSFCQVNQLLRTIYNRYITLVPDGREVKIHLNLDVPNPSYGFVTDQRLLSGALQILIDNAVKYTLKGEIGIRYEMVAASSVRFTISDTGIGIPPEENENIFSRFYRVQNEINDKTSGSGIGLPIAQHYIQLLGGELKLESTPGRGSLFSFSLPFREGEGYLRVVS